MVAEYSSSIKPEHEHQASVCLDLSLHDSIILLYDKSLKNSVMLPVSFFITYYIDKKILYHLSVEIRT